MGNEKVLVGIFNLGGFNINLFASDISGGEFTFAPKPDKIPEINIGIDYINFSEVVRILVHEAFEFCFSAENYRYVKSNDWADSHDAYLFIMTHPEFSDVAAKAGAFIADAISPLGKVWLKRKKERIKAAKKRRKS